MGIEHPHIKKEAVLLLSQNSLAQTSSLALSLVLVEQCWKLSPVSRWSTSSTATQGQTSVSNSASRSLILIFKWCLLLFHRNITFTSQGNVSNDLECIDRIRSEKIVAN